MDNITPSVEEHKPMTSMVVHMMEHHDPENPQNWPMLRKLYASAVATAFAFVVAFGLTAYTPGISGVIAKFNVSMTAAVLPMSLYLVGIAFAPIMTPHLSERLGRSPVYFISLPIFSLFIIGAGASKSFASLVVCRFFAGFFGGPCLVLIEGTFADVWSGNSTVTYYSFLSLASYIGAACGPLVGGFVFAATSWRWTQWITLMLALAAYLFGIGVPETYPREILRQRARRSGVHHNLAPALSGVTIGDMVRVTVIEPVKQLVTEPIVTLISFYLCFNFGILFSWFIAVPAVLETVYSFNVQQVGLAFVAAIAGSLVAALTSIIIERITIAKLGNKSNDALVMGMIDIEYRLIPAMIGGIGMTASLFWIGWTASPKISWASPVIGTAVYVWGSMSILISAISYLFDAYPPRGTLSALTAAASLRLLLAAAIPLVIIQMIMGLTGGWAYSTFGFISAAMIPLPFVLFKFGPSLRARSKYNKMGHPGHKTNEFGDEGDMSSPA